MHKPANNYSDAVDDFQDAYDTLLEQHDAMVKQYIDTREAVYVKHHEIIGQLTRSRNRWFLIACFSALMTLPPTILLLKTLNETRPEDIPARPVPHDQKLDIRRLSPDDLRDSNMSVRRTGDHQDTGGVSSVGGEASVKA